MSEASRLRALAHPLRWKLLDLILAETTATATRCAEALGESVASCSYHLNILAKYGYVEEAPAGRGGREKPWRMTSAHQDLSPDGPGVESALASEAVTEVFLDHELDRLKANARRRDGLPDGWREATGLGGSTTFLTEAELRDVTTELQKIVFRYADRVEHPALRPAGGREVRLFFATSVVPPRPGAAGG